MSRASEAIALVMSGNGYTNDVRHPDFAPDRGLTRNERIVITGLLGTMIAATILGNLLVIFSFLTDKKLRAFHNWFILSLAVADGLVGAAVMPLTLVYELTGRWEFGAPLCKTWQYLDAVCCSSSILNLCAIGVARYLSVSRPFQYGLHLQTSNTAAFMILLVWCVSLTANLPLVVGWVWDDNPPPGPLQCQIVDHVGFIVYSALVTFFVPVAVMVTVTVAIGNVMRKKMKRVHAAGASVSRPAQDSSTLVLTHVPPRHKLEQDAVALENQQQKQSVQRTVGKTQRPVILTTTERGVNVVESSSIRTESAESDDGDTVSRSSRAEHLNAAAAVATDGEVVMEMQTLKVKQGPHPVPLSHYGSCSHTTASPRHLQTSAGPKPGTSSSSIQTAPGTSTATSVTPHITSTTGGRVSTRSSNRVMRTLAVVLVFFIVCWSPFYVIYLVRPLCTSCEVHPEIITMSIWLGYFNSTLNPVLYAAMNKDFRRDFRRILTLEFLGSNR